MSSIISLDYTGNFNRFDTENMYDQIISLPKQIEESYFNQEKSELAIYYKNISKVYICGMGGSAISGDIAKSLFGDTLKIRVFKDYYLPTFLDENTLGIVCSYSGNTAETVACFETLRKKGAQIAIVTSGGILKHYGSQEGYLMKLVPTGFQPRAAIGHLFFSIVKILEELGLIEDQNINVKLTHLNLTTKLKLINQDVEEGKNFAKGLAMKLYKKIPIIYSSNPRLFPLAYRFKCQINENAKTHAFCNTFSEMNHNEIEGWETDYNNSLVPVFISNFDEEKMYLDRVNAFKEILKTTEEEKKKENPSYEEMDFLEIFTDGKTLMGKTFSTIFLCDMISYYLAILNRVNPSSIKFIDSLKKTIKS
ncbi:MAG TPA: bifunctional phosphoglucose/phosphomannose isomerase [Candidatus Cloacimonetes bacterium]|nr:bifunctional phosphoglucose/phosphomannose isomerase [Candidatus Cloacimonadota bacterium]HEX38221.1 bifunctional phosphoglucose/phosphomannose isomerase [Candidatus Cloacimonadota bacterium]